MTSIVRLVLNQFDPLLYPSPLYAPTQYQVSLQQSPEVNANGEDQEHPVRVFLALDIK
jgi:predicted component of type VI protein secretion system